MTQTVIPSPLLLLDKHTANVSRLHLNNKFADYFELVVETHGWRNMEKKCWIWPLHGWKVLVHTCMCIFPNVSKYILFVYADATSPTKQRSVNPLMEYAKPLGGKKWYWRSYFRVCEGDLFFFSCMVEVSRNPKKRQKTSHGARKWKLTPCCLEERLNVSKLLCFLRVHGYNVTKVFKNQFLCLKYCCHVK